MKKKNILLLAVMVLCIIDCNMLFGQSWNLAGNAGSDPNTQFVGTTDIVALRFRTNNVTRINITSGGKLGFGTGTSAPAGWFHIKGKNNESQLVLDGAGTQSNANPIIRIRSKVATDLLWINSDHPTNSFFGKEAGLSNDASSPGSEGKSNTFIGSGSGNTNSTGSFNTALGNQSFLNNTTGAENVAIGFQALQANTDRSGLVAVGSQALANNGIGANIFLHATDNTAVGYQALIYNTIGDSNTALGRSSAGSNLSGALNTAIGNYALFSNEYGAGNTALGHMSGFGSAQDTINNCTFLGSSTSLTVSRNNVTMLGFGVTNGMCTGNNQVILGNSAIQQIRAQVTGITAFSDARYKVNVKDDIKGLEFINRLKPVSYNVNPLELHKIWGTPESEVAKLDFTGTETIRYSGFIAQEVEQAATESNFNFTGIDVPKNKTETYALRYTEFILPIVKAIQEQQAIIESQNSRIASLENQLAQLLNEVISPKILNSAPSNLGQNSPNPFSSTTRIDSKLPAESTSGLIAIYDLKGKEINRLAVTSEKSSIEFDASTLAPGTYTYSLIVNGSVIETKQMMVSR